MEGQVHDDVVAGFHAAWAGVAAARQDPRTGDELAHHDERSLRHFQTSGDDGGVGVDLTHAGRQALPRGRVHGLADPHGRADQVQLIGVLDLAHAAQVGLDVPHLSRHGSEGNGYGSALNPDDLAPEFPEQVDGGLGRAVGAGDVGFSHAPGTVNDLVGGRLDIELGEPVEDERRGATALDDEVLRRAVVDVIRRRHVVGQVEDVLGPRDDECLHIGVNGFEQAARARAASLSAEHGVPQPSSGAAAGSLSHRRATVES